MVSEHKSYRKLGRIRAATVDLQHLRYAVAAADHGSFRRAAEVLLLQQSKLSRCIGQLEHSLGMIVFVRSSGGVGAEAARGALFPKPVAILVETEVLVQSTHPARGRDSERVAR